MLEILPPSGKTTTINEKANANCLNCGSLKEKLAQNVLIVEIFLRGGQNSRHLKLWGQKMQLSQKKSLD